MMEQQTDKPPVRKRVLVRLPADLHRAIKQRSQHRVRSINNEIIVLLKLGLANEVEESRSLSFADEIIQREKAEVANQSNSID